MIARKVTIITLALNGAVNFLAAAGSAEVWGISYELGVGETIESAQQAAQEVGSGPSGFFDAAVGMTIAAISLFADLLQIPFAAPTMLLNVGVPAFIVTFLFVPLYVVVAIDIIAILRGDSGI